jgi:hypothetical protein
LESSWLTFLGKLPFDFQETHILSFYKLGPMRNLGIYKKFCVGKIFPTCILKPGV